jgi:hypothetical protein
MLFILVVLRAAAGARAAEAPRGPAPHARRWSPSAVLGSRAAVAGPLSPLSLSLPLPRPCPCRSPYRACSTRALTCCATLTPQKSPHVFQHPHVLGVFLALQAALHATPPGGVRFSPDAALWRGTLEATEGLGTPRVNVTDCGRLRAAIDSYCAFNISQVRRALPVCPQKQREERGSNNLVQTGHQKQNLASRRGCFAAPVCRTQRSGARGRGGRCADQGARAARRCALSRRRRAQTTTTLRSRSGCGPSTRARCTLPSAVSSPRSPSSPTPPRPSIICARPTQTPATPVRSRHRMKPS